MTRSFAILEIDSPKFVNKFYKFKTDNVRGPVMNPFDSQIYFIDVKTEKIF